MKKIIKLSVSILLTFIMVLTSMINANAAADTINIGTASKIPNSYINGISFSYKYTADGRYLYCLNRHKSTATNTQARLVANSSLVDGGVLHILKNGYPERSITGNNEQDYYITQMAVWMYLDQTHGTNNVGSIKSTPSEANMINQVNRLVNEGKAHRYESASQGSAALAIDAPDGPTFTPLTGYYLSNEIRTIKSSNVSSYAVVLENQPANTLIFQSGREFQYTGAFTVGVNETFRIKIMNEAASNRTITVNATAVGTNGYGAYEYQPVNGAMQNVVLLEKGGTTARSSVSLTLTTVPQPTPTPTPKWSSKVTITKIDAGTNKPLAGAKLVVKDSNNKVVASWTSTTNAYVINDLAKGFYTLEETEAPKGYALNKNVKKFTIDDKNKDIKINFENEELGTLSIIKIDSNTKKPISGAVLVLKDANGRELSRWTSTINAHIIKNLTEGTYTVEEVSAPTGYQLNQNPVTIKVTGKEKSYKVNFENTPKNSVVNIIKIDSSTNSYLSGAVLIVKDSAGNIVERFTTTNAPHVITNLANGTYTVEEESAPAGYIKSNERISFTINENQLSHQITMTNTKETPVPNTGTESIILALIGTIIIGIGLDYILKHAKA